MRRSHCLGLAVVLCFLTNCTEFDPLEQTGPSINRTEADYSNDATLLNILRSIQQEPLTFVTITGLDGTASVTGSLGLATWTLGPLAASAKRNYAFGPNSVGRTNSNTFHVSVVDDPTSFAGLMAPVNPAVLAFLLRQGYKPALLFFLLTSEIREVQLDPATGEVSKVMADYLNDPNDSKSYQGFIGKMASLLLEGLVAQVDATAFPSGRTMPASRLCMDEVSLKPQFGVGVAVPKDLPNNGSSALCDRTGWVEADTSASSGAAGGSGKADNTLTSVGVSQDGALWAMVGPKNQLVRVSPDGKVLAVNFSPQLMAGAIAKPKQPAHIAAFSFEDRSGRHYQILFRSTIGAYRYIGAYQSHPIDNLLSIDESGSGSLINIVDQSPAGCFAEVDFRGKSACVPQTASNTKQLFSVLHLLQQLQTAPSNAPTTLTVTSVP